MSTRWTFGSRSRSSVRNSLPPQAELSALKTAATSRPSSTWRRTAASAGLLLEVVLLTEALAQVAREQSAHDLVVVHDDEQRLD
jgi:hypothetical protein